MRDDSAEILFQSFLAGGPCEQLCHRHGCPLFDVVHPAFPLPTTASPTLQGALKNGFKEAVVACDMPESCKFRLLTVATRGSCGPTRKLILLPPFRWSCAPSRRCGEVSSGLIACV